MAEAAIGVFIDDPSYEALLDLRIDDLVAVAAHYSIKLKKQARKAEIVAAIHDGLIDQGVLMPLEVKDSEGEEEEVLEPAALLKENPSPPALGSSVEADRLRQRVSRLEVELKDKEERRRLEFLKLKPQLMKESGYVSTARVIALLSLGLNGSDLLPSEEKIAFAGCR